MIRPDCFKAQTAHLPRLLVLAALAVALGCMPRALFGQTASAVKIGIIGAGNIGGTVGALWVKAGHPVLFSSRHPEQLKPIVDRLGPLARAGTVRQALEFGEVIFLAVPYSAYPQIGKDYAKELAGKIVLDAGNAFAGRDGAIAQEARTNGIGITSAKYLAGARIVRAFNTLNYQRLPTLAQRAGRRVAIPVASDDAEALAMASTLIHNAGFDAVVVGPLESARHFASGGPLYGLELGAEEMHRRLKSLR